MTQDNINNIYFEWLFGLVCENRFSRQNSYKKLLMHLHDVEFIYPISKDQNRAEDGVDLRYRFATTQCHRDSIDIVMDTLDGPCSVLEMMIALAIRCEENIMDCPNVGNRTGQWFWGMVTNLGLGAMIDSRYDRRRVDVIINRFLRREYEPDGRGGLFTIDDCDVDLRGVEIWHQLCWYLDDLI